jgi:hypothetical protein
VVVPENVIFILIIGRYGKRMKKTRIHWFTLALFSTCSFAAPALHLGGGVNLSSTTATDSLSASKSPRRGFNVSFGFEQYFSTHLSLISGLSVETRGEKTKSTTNLGSDSIPIIDIIESDIYFLYLQIPLLVQYNLPIGPGKINVFAGPELGILLQGEVRSIDNTTIPGVGTITTPDTMAVASEMKTADGGISAGLGYEIAFGQSSVFCRPSYYYGLTDYFKNGPKGKLTNIKLQLGYKFTFAR